MEEQFTVKGIHGNSTMNRAAYEEYQQALNARRSMGRYSLEEAALLVAENSNANARSIYTKLENSAETGELTIHWPGSDEVYKPKPRNPLTMNPTGVRGFEEAYWCNLNKWLEIKEPRIFEAYPFPKPDAPAAKVKAGTTPGNDWKEKALTIADELALEKYQRGEREITARNISNAVATELAKDSTTHGIRGERSAGNIRNEALKGWKFIPPTGTNGTSGTSGTKK